MKPLSLSRAAAYSLIDWHSCYRLRSHTMDMVGKSFTRDDSKGNFLRHTSFYIGITLYVVLLPRWSDILVKNRDFFITYLYSPLEYCHNVWCGKLEWRGWLYIPHGEKNLKICYTRFGARHQHDKRTDRQTDLARRQQRRAAKWHVCYFRAASWSTRSSAVAERPHVFCVVKKLQSHSRSFKVIRNNTDEVLFQCSGLVYELSLQPS